MSGNLRISKGPGLVLSTQIGLVIFGFSDFRPALQASRKNSMPGTLRDRVAGSRKATERRADGTRRKGFVRLRCTSPHAI